MQLPLQITFRNMDPSEAVEAKIKERAEKLERFTNKITSCRVNVEAPHKHQHKGSLYHVRIDITVPGEELVVSRKPDKHHEHENVYAAVRDAFDAARRMLEDRTRRQRSHEKTHVVPPHGKVIEILQHQDFGRIETPDGREIYFHRNSVVNGDFDQIEEGAEVRFHEDQGDNGPQASSVQVIGKHHILE